jgi:serine/threonine protein phosphatase 1
LEAGSAASRAAEEHPAEQMTDRHKFARLNAARRVWSVASIHGDAERLGRLHGLIWDRLQPGDRVVYLGNMIGRGPAVGETLNELLAFRRLFLAGRNAFASDLVYLRGAQEEIWQKLLQLQFSQDPKRVLNWMVEFGVGSTLDAYGTNVELAREAAGSGAVVLTRWTSGLRRAIRQRPGHFQLYAALRRAAFTADGCLLLVNAGLDPERPLETQFDSFWWGGDGFSRITEPYGQFRKMVRGFEPHHPGLVETDYTLTVDGGCGFGGALMAACLTPAGELVDHVET